MSGPAHAELLRIAMGLPAPRTSRLTIERDLPAAMTDGTLLLADRYAPHAAGPMPTVLVRSPYGRRGVYGLLYGVLFAQQGLQVVIQSTRGTFGSGGDFEPFAERADGLDTIAWLGRQPWHSGKIGMAGASYLGLAQWAVAAAAGDALGAIAPAVSASSFHGATHGGGLALESMASWYAMIAAQEGPLAPLRMAAALSRLRFAFGQLPLGQLDERFAGRAVPAFREALAHPDAGDPYWTRRDHGTDLAGVQAPALLVAGWHDLFTPWQIDDYVKLRRAGRTARLVVGPWTHLSEGMWARSTRESVRWLRGHLIEGPPPRPGVRVFVTGAVGGRWPAASGEWRELRDWPPPDGDEQTLFLHASGRLSQERPSDSRPDAYRYDPADPTPSLGGPVLLSRSPVVNNGPLERRADVLTYTTAKLQRPLEAIGPVQASLYVRSSRQHFDVFARLCDVDRWGISRNVCDALAGVSPGQFEQGGDGSTRVAFDLWPTAHRFEAGHRLRLQVSSGAHPRYARNPGTGEPLTTATRLVVADQEVLHDPVHQSALVLWTDWRCHQPRTDTPAGLRSV